MQKQLCSHIYQLKMLRNKVVKNNKPRGISKQTLTQWQQLSDENPGVLNKQIDTNHFDTELVDMNVESRPRSVSN